MNFTCLCQDCGSGVISSERRFFSHSLGAIYHGPHSLLSKHSNWNEWGDSSKHKAQSKSKISSTPINHPLSSPSMCCAGRLWSPAIIAPLVVFHKFSTAGQTNCISHPHPSLFWHGMNRTSGAINFSVEILFCFVVVFCLFGFFAQQTFPKWD